MQVSYIKAIDVWVVSSLIFVFAALLEFAYVNVLARRADKEMAMVEVLARSQLFGERIQVEACPESARGPHRFPHLAFEFRFALMGVNLACYKKKKKKNQLKFWAFFLPFKANQGQRSEVFSGCVKALRITCEALTFHNNTV